MTTHGSASVREETPHSEALKRRAQAVITDRSIDSQWRAVIRYGLETNDPWLAELVRRADAGERIVDTTEFWQSIESNAADPNEEKVEALAEIICRAGDESAAALFVLMGTLEHSAHPTILANRAKHFAFRKEGRHSSQPCVSSSTHSIPPLKASRSQRR